MAIFHSFKNNQENGEKVRFVKFCFALGSLWGSLCSLWVRFGVRLVRFVSLWARFEFPGRSILSDLKKNPPKVLFSVGNQNFDFWVEKCAKRFCRTKTYCNATFLVDSEILEGIRAQQWPSIIFVGTVPALALKKASGTGNLARKFILCCHCQRPASTCGSTDHLSDSDRIWGTSFVNKWMMNDAPIHSVIHSFYWVCINH